MRRYYVWRKVGTNQHFLRSVIARNADDACRKVAKTTMVLGESELVAYPAGNPV